MKERFIIKVVKGIGILGLAIFASSLAYLQSRPDTALYLMFGGNTLFVLSIICMSCLAIKVAYHRDIIARMKLLRVFAVLLFLASIGVLLLHNMYTMLAVIILSMLVLAALFSAVLETMTRNSEFK